MIKNSLSKHWLAPLFFSLILLMLNQNVFGQDLSPVWGNWYRTNAYLPIKISNNDKDGLFLIKNKYTEDKLNFIGKKPIESLLKMTHDSTLVEIYVGTNIPNVIPLNIQILQTNKPFIAIVSNEKKELEQNENFVSVSISELPELEASYQMVDAILLTQKYPATLNKLQVNALCNWVFMGGILYFDDLKTMQQHPMLVVELLKPFIKKDNPHFNQLSEDLKKATYHKYAQKIFIPSQATSTLNGVIGIFSNDANSFAKEMYLKQMERMKWHLRSNNFNTNKKSKIKEKIEANQTSFLGKLFLVLFMCMLGTTLLKIKYSPYLCSFLALLAVFPILYITPTLNVDGRLESFINLSETLNYQSKTEALSIIKKKDLSLKIDLDGTTPFYSNSDCKIKFNRNNQNKFQSMEIISKQKELNLYRKTFDNSFYATAKFINEKPEIYMNQKPTEIYTVQENKLVQLNFETSKKNSLFKVSPSSPSNILNRDDFDQELWYPETNRIFYSDQASTNSLTLIKGLVETIDITIDPPLGAQETSYNILLKNNTSEH